jgi:hypothetical protein
MLNRSAVAIRPKQPFLDWLKSVEELSLQNMKLSQLEKTLYLVPDYEDPKDADKVLSLVCEEIFCRELEGWYTDETTWPQDRGLAVFLCRWKTCRSKCSVKMPGGHAPITGWF